MKALRKFNIDLPHCGDWDNEGNYAANLRAAAGGGCNPTGVPEIAVKDAGTACFALGDRIVTIGDDRHEVFIDSVPAGSLGSPFVAALTDSDGAIMFTADGPEWFVGGKTQGSAPQSGVATAAELWAEDSTQVLLPELRGNYPRNEGPLSATDLPSLGSAVASALELLELRAHRAGAGVQPMMVAWRFVDVDGRTVASGEPQLSGVGVQGDSTLEFAATRNGSTFIIDSSALMNIKQWKLRVETERSASEFWRGRIARLELFAAPLPELFKGVNGYFSASGSASSVLNLTAVFDLQGAVEKALATFAVQARRVAVVENPLEGYSGMPAIDFSEGKESVRWNDAGRGNFVPSRAARFGSLTVYCFAGKPGVMAVAPSGNPLQISGSERVSRGRILAVTSPVGSGGGWNYGRHHLLVFATDGIYGVSIDRTLSIITSTLLHGADIDREDAVATAPDAVYAATADGTLLRLKGSRAEVVESPLRPVALTYVMPACELWLLGPDGRLATIDRRGRCTLRTDVKVKRFVGAGLGIDTANSIRQLAREGREAVGVEWCRRLDYEPGGMHRCSWEMSSAQVWELKLALLAESGGASQRVVELTVDGAVNAPIDAEFASPQRLRATARIGGVVARDTRFRSVRLVRE